MSQLWIIGFRTFSPINITLCVHFRRTMGSGGPRVIVVNLGASNCDMSVSMSTERRDEMLIGIQWKENMEGLTFLRVLNFLCCLCFNHFHGLNRCNGTCFSYLRRGLSVSVSRNWGRFRHFFVGRHYPSSPLSSTRSTTTTSSTSSTTTFSIRLHCFNARIRV